MEAQTLSADARSPSRKLSLPSLAALAITAGVAFGLLLPDGRGEQAFALVVLAAALTFLAPLLPALPPGHKFRRALPTLGVALSVGLCARLTIDQRISPGAAGLLAVSLLASALASAALAQLLGVSPRSRVGLGLAWFALALPFGLPFFASPILESLPTTAQPSALSWSLLCAPLCALLGGFLAMDPLRSPLLYERFPIGQALPYAYPRPEEVACATILLAAALTAMVWIQGRNRAPGDP